MSSLPPALAVGAHYDSLLQSALRQFFGRAVLDTEPTPSLSSDGRLAIEPSSDPYALTIRWFGTRYKLRVKAWPFTPHEVRFARAIGTVLAARYRAILNPRIVAERGDLFRGMIEDRYVGAFLDDKAYAIDAREARADRIASIIELLRVAALSSYESRSISTGVLLLGTEDDPCRPGRHVAAHGAVSYAETLTGVKSFFRLADGVRTVFLANADGRLLDIIDIDRWSNEVCNDRTIDTPCSKTYQPHARATQRLGHVCAVLSPSREIKVFAEGAEVFTFRGAGWHLLDLKAKYDLWAKAVRNDALALRLFQTALDLADAREGALFVVARDPSAAVPQLVAAADRLDTVVMPSAPGATVPSRRDLLHLLAGRSVPDLDPTVFSALASIDGATVTDRAGRLLAAGAILRHPATEDYEHGGIIEGARTTAAMAASRFGPVLKVSEDGIITFFDGEPIWDI
jgi:hypothetical protein